MRTRAKLYIAATVTLGLVALARGAMFSYHPLDLPRLMSYLAVTILASMWKVRLPGLTGTISLNFVFILIGLIELSVPEAVLLACSGAIAQLTWKVKRKPTLVQFAFNVAVLAISVSLAHRTTQFLLAGEILPNLSMLLCAAGTVYCFTNLLLVSGVIALKDERSLLEVWRQFHLWTFPYHLAGGIIAGLICQSSRAVGWQLPLLLLPLLYFLYTFYRLCLERMTPLELR